MTKKTLRGFGRGQRAGQPKHLASGLMSRAALRTHNIRVLDTKDSMAYLTSDNDGVAKFSMLP
jgi:hypothetical protein